MTALVSKLTATIAAAPDAETAARQVLEVVAETLEQTARRLWPNMGRGTDMTPYGMLAATGWLRLAARDTGGE